MPTTDTTKHTPGPWHSIRFGSGRISIGQSGGAQTTVCDLNPAAYENGDEIEANARLIAAAPELLAALRDAVAALDVAFDSLHDAFGAHHNDATDALASARAAIAKAEGAK